MTHRRPLAFAMALALTLTLAALLGGPVLAQPAPEGIIVVPPSDQLQVSISVEKDYYFIGETIRIFYEVSRDAYVYVIDIDAGGTVRMIFPNRFSRDNFVAAGQHVLPDRPTYNFLVVPPTGTELVQIIASLEPIDLGVRGFLEAFPLLGDDPSRFQQQAEAAIQGIAVTGQVATAYTSFQVVGPTPPSNRAPVARFSFRPTNPGVGQTVFFDASGSYDPDGFIVSYRWDFNGDGFTDATGVRVTRAFFTPGWHRVTLTVTDNGGLSSSTTQTLQVGRPNQPPVAAFSFSPFNPQVGQEVLFDASGSYDPDGFITGYRWDFNGDGFTDATGVRASWTFFTSGSHRVTLTVADDDGLSGSTTQFVQVGPAAPSGVAGFFIDAVDGNQLRIRVQGKSSWLFQGHAYKIILDTDGDFIAVHQQGTGTGAAAPSGIVPVPTPSRDHLELSGRVRDGSVTYLITLSDDATKVKFNLQLDTDGDGFLERRTDFVFLGPEGRHPPSNPFIISFPAGELEFGVSLQVCLVLFDQPGFRFTICFRLGNL